MHSNELRHYGVLGMKWGIRRYRNKDGSLTAAGQKRYGKGGTARYTSWSTKRRQKNATTKSNQARAKASQSFDDAYRDYANKTSVGKAVVGNILLSPFKYKTYAMARTAGESRGKAAVRAIFDLGVGIAPIIPPGITLQRHAIREKYINDRTDTRKPRTTNSAKGDLYRQKKSN